MSKRIIEQTDKKAGMILNLSIQNLIVKSLNNYSINETLNFFDALSGQLYG
jgi:hypothetical protein